MLGNNPIRNGVGRSMRRRQQLGARRIVDAGGQRLRQQESRAAKREYDQKVTETLNRIAKAAGKIPVLKTLEEVASTTANRREKPVFPAYVVSSKLTLDGVLHAVNGQQGVNVRSSRAGEMSVGPHFDTYFNGGFLPWIVHHNERGGGVLQARHMAGSAFATYVEAADTIEKLPYSNEERDDLLADARARIAAEKFETPQYHGSLRLIFNRDLPVSTDIHEAMLIPDTTSLIWQGTEKLAPAMHNFVRNEPGDYTIYAHQKDATPPLGFDPV
ncbi:MAG: hypothetical protein U5L95_02285 [Candidatus Saccharibacteria bacterium]|nr:hypothetical protein [Candidatus Saccharibacteria bacterium]